MEFENYTVKGVNKREFEKLKDLEEKIINHVLEVVSDRCPKESINGTKFSFNYDSKQFMLKLDVDKDYGNKRYEKNLTEAQHFIADLIIVESEKRLRQIRGVLVNLDYFLY